MIKNDVKDFDELLDVKYGKRGTPKIKTKKSIIFATFCNLMCIYC